MKSLIFLSFIFLSRQAFCADLLTTKSSFSHTKTLKLLKKAVKAKKLKHFMTFEHHKGAKKAKLDLRPTTLIVFGNPKVGTLLMKESQLVGIALPMKLLVHDDEKGQTWVSYDKPEALQKDYSLEQKGKVFAKLKKALKSIVSAVE